MAVSPVTTTLVSADNPGVGNCCSPKGYCWIFSERRARAEAKRYRRKGLDVTSRRIVDFLKQQGVHGRTLIEVGGGVGGIQIDLLKAGVASAISIELTPTYEEAAWALLREAGLADRVERKVMDFAEAAAEVKAADIVIMNRVVCCYPDYERLLGAAAQRARRLLVFSYPPRNAFSRLFVRAENLAFRLLRREYRSFAHPPSAMLGLLGERGLRRTFAHHSPVWQVAGLER